MLIILRNKAESIDFTFILFIVKDCGSDMHGFESHQAPHKKADDFCYLLFYFEEFVGLTEPNEAKPSNGWILMSVLVGSEILKT